MLNWAIESGLTPFVDGESSGLADLWANSVYSSPFLSPPVLAHLARAALDRGGMPIAAVGLDGEGRTAAFWPLVESPEGRIEFLQRRLCDHGTALYRADVSVADLAEGFVAVLQKTATRNVFLNNLPSWDRSREACERALEICGWRLRSIDAAADPVLIERPGPDLVKRLSSHVSGKSLRNYSNRLLKTEGYAFEVLEDATELSAWATEFCDRHDWRWASTNTPSDLASPEQRKDFEETLRAWAAAGTLVRFAIRIGRQRVALAVVLRAGDRLIYHRSAHSPRYGHTRAATVLIRNLVVWMAERGDAKLDFGLGGELYKYRFATDEERLWRVYGSKSFLSKNWFASWAEHTIRASPSLQRLWDRVGNDWFQGVLQAQLRRIRSQFRKAAAKLAGCRAPEEWPHAVPAIALPSSIHAAVGCEDESALTCHPLPMAEVLSQIEARWPLSTDDRLLFYERYEAGWSPHALRHGDVWGPIAWLWKDPYRPEHWWVRSSEIPETNERAPETAELLASLRTLAGPERRLLAESGTPGGFRMTDLQIAGFSPIARSAVSEVA